MWKWCSALEVLPYFEKEDSRGSVTLGLGKVARSIVSPPQCGSVDVSFGFTLHNLLGPFLANVPRVVACEQNMQLLEPTQMSLFRTLCLAAAATVLPLASVSAVTLGGLEIGGQKLDIEISITDPRGAVTSNGFVHVVGNDGGVGVRQIIDLANGTISEIETFTSQHVAQNGGLGGIPDSFLFGVSVLADGSVVYHGDSSNGTIAGTPTYWFDPTLPISAAQFSSDVGSINAISPSGVTAGFLNFDGAAVGSLSQPLHVLPGGPVGNVFDISQDNRYLVGNGIWEQVAPGTVDYVLLDTSLWEAPTNSLTFPSQFNAVLQLDNSYLFVGEYIDATLFANRVGIWDDQGNFLGGTLAGDSFADIGLFEGEVILGVNGINGGALYSLSDLSSALLLSDLYGSPVELVSDSFFVGSLGFIGRGASGGIFGTSFESSPTGGTEVPEPATAILVLGGAALLRRAKRRL